METYNSRYTANGNGNHTNGHGRGHSTNGNGHHHSLIDVPATMDETLSDPDLLRRYELDFPAVKLPQIEIAITDILDAVGENPSREGLQGTPNRVARAYDEMLHGYRMDPAKLINNAVFESTGEDMVIVRDAQYFSMCEHHMLPFVGHAHIAYIPNGKIIGLSKIPRIVEMFARRLQVQERLTRQIAEFIDEVLQPLGVAVVMDGTHMCSMIRGVEDTHSGMTTSTYLGVFKENRDLRNEFLTHIQRAGGKTFQM